MRVGTLHKLNAKGIKSAGNGMHSDGGGLFLQIKGNARSWTFRFTWDGKKREMGLGSASTVTLAQARAKAAEARELIGQGIDPRHAAKASDGPVVQRKVVRFSDAMHTYIAAHQATWSNAKHSAQWESSLTRHAGGLMRRDVAEITTADIEATLAPIWLTKCETAGRVRQRIERILSAAIALGDRPAPNPAA